MNTILTACRKQGVLAMALIALIARPQPAGADFLVRTFVDDPAASVRRPLPEPHSTLHLPMREPLTGWLPHEDTAALDEKGLDEAKLAVVLQALLVCAIPPPVNTVIETELPPEEPPTLPGVPAPPPFEPVTFPPGSGTSGSPPPTDAPEPASLLLALVGTGLAGMMMWRRGRKRKRQEVPAV